MTYKLKVWTSSRAVDVCTLFAYFFQPFTLQKSIFSEKRRTFPCNLDVPWNSSEQTIASRERGDGS